MKEAEDLLHDRTEAMKAAALDLKEKATEAGTVAWDLTKAKYHELEDQAAACTQAADRTLREHTYTALGIAFGVGVLVGVFLTNGHSAGHEQSD
jgi:ElaB/YqjD/DUF883 family membrane-anchored ribosome-binding protein